MVQEIKYLCQFIENLYLKIDEYNKFICRWRDPIRAQIPKALFFKKDGDWYSLNSQTENYANKINEEIVKPIKDSEVYTCFYNYEVSLEENYERNEQFVQNYLDKHETDDIPIIKKAVNKYIEIKLNISAELLLLQELKGFFQCLDKIISHLLNELWADNDRPKLDTLDISSFFSEYTDHIKYFNIKNDIYTIDDHVDITMGYIEPKYNSLDFANSILAIENSFISINNSNYDSENVVEMINKLTYLDSIVSVTKQESDGYNNRCFLSIEKIEELHNAYYNEIYDVFNLYHLTFRRIVLDEIRQLLNYRLIFWEKIEEDTETFTDLIDGENGGIHFTLTSKFMIYISNIKMTYIEKLIEKLSELKESKINSHVNASDYNAETISCYYERAKVTHKYIEKIKENYQNILEQYKHHFNKEGIITPLNFDEFYEWIVSSGYPNTKIYEITIDSSDFTLFHEYKKSLLDNNIEPTNGNTMDVNYERIFEIALNNADDPAEMKAICIREQKKADRDHFYEKDNFYKSLMKVVADKKELAKYKPGPTPTHIGSFFIAGGGGSGYNYESVELVEQIINEIWNEDEIRESEILETPDYTPLLKHELQTESIMQQEHFYDPIIKIPEVKLPDIGIEISDETKKNAETIQRVFNQWQEAFGKSVKPELQKNKNEKPPTPPQISEPPLKENVKHKSKHKEGVIKRDRLALYFSPKFKGMGHCENDFEKLIKELDTITEDFEKKRIGKKIAQIALMVYNSDKINARKPEFFVEWHKEFCDCIGTNYIEYYPSKLEPYPKHLKDLFIYLF